MTDKEINNVPTENVEVEKQEQSETTLKKDNTQSKESYFALNRILKREQNALLKEKEEFQKEKNTYKFSNLFNKSGGKSKYLEQVIKIKSNEIISGEFDEKILKTWKKELDWAFENNTISHVNTDPKIEGDDRRKDIEKTKTDSMSLKDYYKKAFK